jgi:hypothetical protein
MRMKLAFIGVGAAVLMTGLNAKANFILNYTRVAITSGPNAGLDFVQFRAFNDGLNGTGTKLLGTGITLTAFNGPNPHFVFRLAHLDADNALDADVNMNPTTTVVNYADGVTPPRTTQPFSTNPISPNTGTAIRPRGTGENFADWNAQFFIPADPFSKPTVVTDPDGNVISATPTTNPQDRYNNTNINSFRVEGVYLGPGSSPLANNLNGQPTPASTGAGALFATAVIPQSTLMSLSGQLAGDTGSPQTVFFIEPEPASLGVLGVFCIGFLGARRQRNAKWIAHRNTAASLLAA